MIESALLVLLMKLSALDLNLLIAFDTLAREGSVTRAAAKLNMSQPALSGALARLRAHFDDPLFVRQGGQMRPTARAQQLARPIGEAIAGLREALEPGAMFRPETSNRSFTIAATDYVEAMQVGRLMSAMQRDAPEVSLRTVRPPQMFWPPEEALREGVVDLALGLFAAEVRPRPDLLFEPMAQDRLVAIVRKNHPRVKHRLDLRTFIKVPHIRIIYPEDVRAGFLDSVLAGRGLQRKVVLTVANLISVPGIVADSDLLGVAPERLARLWRTSYKLQVFDLPIPIPELPLTMVWHASRQSDPGQRWLRDLIARELGAKPAPRRRA